jgi:hypothetical protein
MTDPFEGDKRAADFVIVPDVAGLPFLAAREIASAVGLSLANPDPDGPPIGAIVWPNNPTIQSQQPEPGSMLYRWDSHQVWLRSDYEPDMAPKLDDSPPSVDRANATPETPPESIEITRTSGADESAL